MTDLIALMNSLVDNKGKILVPGIYDSVEKVTEDEEKLYENIDFDLVSEFYVIFRGNNLILSRLYARYKLLVVDTML